MRRYPYDISTVLNQVSTLRLGIQVRILKLEMTPLADSEVLERLHYNTDINLVGVIPSLADLL